MIETPPLPTTKDVGRPPHRDSRQAFLCGLGGFLLLLAFLAQCLDLGRRMSCTVDEEGHIAVGVGAWANGDYRITFDNAFFGQRFAGLAPWLAGFQFPTRARQTERGNEAFSIGADFLFHSGNNPVRALALARATVTLLGIAVAALVFVWAREIFGPAAAVGALALFVFCPPVVANASLVTVDVAATLWFTAAAGAYWHLLARPSLGWAALAGVSLGLLLLTKLSAIGFAPIACALLACRLVRGTDSRFWWQIAGAHVALALVAWITLWAFFGFKYSPGDASYPWPQIETWLGPGTKMHRAIMFARKFHLAPEPMLHEWSEFRLLNSQRPSFSLGAFHPGGTLGFFPATLVAKTPPAFLVAIFSAAWLTGLAAWRRFRPAGPVPVLGWRLAGSAPLWCVVFAYSGFCIFSRFNIGHRHLLPIYPALCILGGGALAWFSSRGCFGAIAAGSLLIACAGEAAYLHGRQHAYLSPLLGGPTAAYRWFVDSSTDWGANLPEIAEWQRTQPAGETDPPYYLAHLGVGEIEAYRVRGATLSTETDFDRLGAGCYVFSASRLQMGFHSQLGPYTAALEREYQASLANVAPASHPVRQRLALSRLTAYCRHRPPDERIGDVYFVFRLSAAELHEALHGPLRNGLPESS